MLSHAIYPSQALAQPRTLTTLPWYYDRAKACADVYKYCLLRHSERPAWRATHLNTSHYLDLDWGSADRVAGGSLSRAPYGVEDSQLDAESLENKVFFFLKKENSMQTLA